jgi:hypothetical protein
MLNHRLCLVDDVGAKYYFLSRLNPIERCMESSSVENIKWCHFQTLLVAVVVQELGPGQILAPTTLILHDAGSQHVFQDLVHSFCLAVHLRM